MTSVFLIIWCIWMLFISCVCLFAPQKFQAYLLRRRARARGLMRLAYGLQFWITALWYPKALRVAGLAGIASVLFILFVGDPRRGGAEASEQSYVIRDSRGTTEVIEQSELDAMVAAEQAPSATEVVDYRVVGGGQGQVVRITYRDPITSKMKSETSNLETDWTRSWLMGHRPEGYIAVERLGGTGFLQCEVVINGKTYYGSPSDPSADKVVCKSS